MKTTTKKLLAALSFACAFSAIGAVSVFNSVDANAATADEAKLSMVAGASIRIDLSDEGATGIRYQAVASQTLVSELVSTTEGVTTYKEGAELGMLIVPKIAFDAYDAQVSSADGETDYFKFFESYNKDAIKEKIAYVCNAEDLNANEDAKLGVKIYDIKTENYTLEYQAVAYYTLGGETYYSNRGDARSVAYVADAALLDSESTLKSDEKKAVGNVIEKYISLQNGGDGGTFAENVVTLASFDIKEKYAAPIQATDLEYTVDDADVKIEGTTVTGLSTDGVADVKVTAYEGNVNFTIQVTTKAVKSAQKNDLHSTAGLYTTYGVTTGAIEKQTETNLNAIKNVVFGVGAVPAGAAHSKLTSTNLPYISFTRSGGFTGAYTTKTHGYCVTIEFTGNNMPMVGFYVADDSTETPTYNVVGQKGILATNGFRLNATEATNTFRNRFSVYGFEQLTSNTQSNDNTDSSTGELDRRLLVDTYEKNATYATGEALNCSYNVLAQNPNQRYRYFIRIAGSEDNEVSITAKLVKIDEYNKNGDIVYSCSSTTKYVPAGKADFYKGSIVVYGRPYEVTKLDKIHLFQDNTIANYEKKWNA